MQRRSDYPTARRVLRWTLAIMYVSAGVAHLTAPAKFLAITPDWVPFPERVISATGTLEIAGALALVTRPLRSWAGAAFALYALCVWPANFKHAFAGISLPPIPDSWWYHAPRLAFQPVLIWAALFGAGLVTWPLRHPANAAP